MFKLLSQTEKSLFAARQSLSSVLTTHPSSRHHVRIYSPSFSPIHNSTKLLDTKPASGTLLPQPTTTRNGHRSSATCAHQKAKTFPKTPHPIVATSSPISNEKSVHVMSIFEPRELDFDNCDSQHAETPLPKSVEPGDLVESKAAANLVSVCEEEILDSFQQLEKGSESAVYDAGQATAVGGERPRRACTSLSLNNPTRKKYVRVF